MAENRGGARAGAGRKRAAYKIKTAAAYNTKTIRLNDEEIKALTARAFKNDTSIAFEMRRAIRRYLGME